MLKRIASLAWILFLACLQVVSCKKGPAGSDPALELPTSTPEAQGMDGNVLSTYYEGVRNGAYEEIHSLLVYRHGFLVREEYFRGYRPSHRHRIYSVTKSITSLLIGISLDQGNLSGTTDPILSFSPEYQDLSNLDARKASITLADVLTMRTGFSWNELSLPYSDPQNPIWRMTSSSDWIKYVLDLPMVESPGTRFTYNSGCTILLSGVLRKRTSMDPEEFAKTYLFTPLGISDFEWDRGARNVVNTAWGLHMRPRDLGKVGQLVLQEGMWKGRRVVSTDWIRLSTRAQVVQSPTYGYGFQWWVKALQPGAAPGTGADEMKIAWGYGGQFIFVVPALDVVVVSTAADEESREEGAMKFVQEMLARAVRK